MDGTRELARVGVVAIGRDEGQRLVRCLNSIPSSVGAVVYVDSGSTDGSVERALGRGVEVVSLDPARPFTAARARNEGFARLCERLPDVEIVQFVDGDCQLVEGWVERAVDELERRGEAGAVCGFRRELLPEASVYNRICNMEWVTPPVGVVDGFGGDVAIRVAALREVGGYDGSVIAAEDDELSIRLRRAGWALLRIDASMTLHDANMHHFGQWWSRALRCGHGIGEISRRHPASKGGHFTRHLRRTLAWGFVLPSLALAVAPATSGFSLLALGLYPLQVLRIARSLRLRGFPRKDALLWAASCVASKPVEALGILRFQVRRILGRRSRIIEYKLESP